jgi:hypothetical protein
MGEGGNRALRSKGTGEHKVRPYRRTMMYVDDPFGLTRLFAHPQISLKKVFLVDFR